MYFDEFHEAIDESLGDENWVHSFCLFRDKYRK